MAYLDESPDDRLGEPSGQPLRVLSDGEVKVGHADSHRLDGEERLSVLLVGILEGDVERDALGAESDVEKTSILERHKAGLLGQPESDVAGGEVKAGNSKTQARVVLGSVCYQLRSDGNPATHK